LRLPQLKFINKAKKINANAAFVLRLLLKNFLLSIVFNEKVKEHIDEDFDLGQARLICRGRNLNLLIDSSFPILRREN
jgi:hypothetical protein